MNRFEVHSHSMFSNLRLLDCINKPKDLINRAIDIGLSGIAITDHDCLSAHPEVNIYFNDVVLKEHPNFKVALGNEIYLCPTRESGQPYYHFILIAKNKEGHRALRELSSRAWMNSFVDRGLERVVTTYNDLKEIVNKYPNSLIATTACLGGELSKSVLNLIESEKCGTNDMVDNAHYHIDNFLLMCLELFKDDFYIECAPGQSREQIMVNKRLVKIANAFNIKMVIGTDAHFLKKEDRFVHKAYLNSKEGDREVDAFYEFSYLQTEEQIKENLSVSIGEEYEQMCANSIEIYNKIENYDLRHSQQIPKVEVKDYPIPINDMGNLMEEKYPILCNMIRSSNKIERYWVNECLNKLNDLNKYNDIYLSRLEEEARVKKIIGEKLATNMFAYPVTLQHYCDLFWECGSIVGAGRGSSCSGLNHFLLGITQLDPIEWNLPFWRYLNEERLELGDIDLDLCPSKRPAIINEIKKERGQNFLPSIDELTRKNCGCTLIATFGTETTKSAIQTACRGYRSANFPEGIDSDTAMYMSSLVPSERGFLWDLHTVVYGDEEKDRKPVKMFIEEVNQYPGLLDIMFGIEGLINKRSSHASGVILLDEDPYEFGCFMKTPSGDIITQYDLHMDEAVGMTKYDFLVTEVQDKIRITLELLQKYNEIEKELSLKELYNKYLHPSVLPIEEDIYWKALHSNSIINIFQFDSEVGSQAAKKIKPSSILEMSDANGLMRLMTAEKNEETPMDKYIRFKNNINDWYKEMKEYGLTEEEQEIVKPYFLKSHGVPPSQEQMMMMLMDKNICGFSLKEANTARKIVGKKLMDKIPALRDKVLEQAASSCLGNYIWKCGIGPQMGYSFSLIHSLAYSFIGFQTIYLATKWNPLYWNTACLIVNSASEENEEEIVDINMKEDDGAEYEDLPDRSGKKRKDKSADYAKTAKALGEIINKNINISLIDINKSNYSFEPDVENNRILFALKALSGINNDIINKIFKGRPYLSIMDFMERCPLNKTAMIALIKAGAFDNLCAEWGKELNINPRYVAMIYYLSKVSEPKSKLTLQNFNGLAERNLIPEFLSFYKELFYFNKYLKGHKKDLAYILDDNAMLFYNEYFDIDNINYVNGENFIIQKIWDNIYKNKMDTVRVWLKNNEEEILKELNFKLFKEMWDNYAEGSISAWEMDSLCFYYSEHELSNVNTYQYGISDFNELSIEPQIEKTFRRNGHDIPIFKTTKIIGTVIAKNDTKNLVTILTTSGVVNVKFTKEYYAMYNRQLSQIQPNGTKKVIEKGWFKRGTKILITGFRREDTFVAKAYSHTPTHQLYKIVNIDDEGNLELIHERTEV